MNVSTLEPSNTLLSREEINHLMSEGDNVVVRLANLVEAIKDRLKTEVCSVYLLEANRGSLVLAATVGLDTEGIGRVRMRLDEGLAGLVAQELRPVAERDAKQHPRFKFFKEIGEEAFRSFLGVPLTHRNVLQGVLVVQTEELRDFTEEETALLFDVGRQIGPVVAEARAVGQYIAPVQQRLWGMARNLWWCWDKEAISIFRDLDPIRWRQLDHNPLALLAEMSLEKLEERVKQLSLQGRINYAFRRMHEYLRSEDSWGARNAGVLHARPVAYFSAEFGLHESIPIYSGGLGLLAGDHVKSCSDLGIPFIGMGLYYHEGYFHQQLDINGMQQENYFKVDRSLLPLEPALGRDGKQVFVEVQTRSGSFGARVWRVAVGRSTLFLLDADISSNSPEDRALTARLYGGDDRLRIRQELLLGVGGVRALAKLDIAAGVQHLNEGHSAFALLEMIRQAMESEGLGFDEAAKAIARKTVFTTHTPVPAGHDRFSADLIEEHLGPLREQLGISHDQLMALGRVDPYRHDEPFTMTVIALKLSRRANAVSELHGAVSRAMWSCLWPQRLEDDVPIGHITNGVHVPTWLAPQMQQLYDRHFGPDWRQFAGTPTLWEKIDQVEDGEFWETHLTLKSRLLDFVRRRAARDAARRGESEEIQQQLLGALSHDTLTIGFARRFATYKRANLIFKEIERLADLVNDAKIPIQFVFAGKAHPRDIPGKKVLQGLAQMARDPRFFGKLVVIEDYDINVGRHLVQGVDVWLNNPRRPLEASGTSGEKIVLNGGLNLSVLDGWWAEAYDGRNGFAFGGGLAHVNPDLQDERDAADLMEVLTSQVIPLFYQRDRDGLPREWIKRMKRGVRTLGWRFSADRMVMDYVQNCYIPAAAGRSCNM